MELGKMDEFQRQYSTFYCLLCITGLWPFNHSILAKVQRSTISIIILCFVTIQFFSLRMSELTFNNILVTLSIVCPLLTVLSRYVGFIYSFSCMGFIIDNINTDYIALKNSVELDILMRNIDASKRIVLMHLLICGFGISIVILVLGFPSMLNFVIAENITQPHYLKLIGFYVEDRYVTVTSVYAIVAFTMTLLIVPCAEGSFAIFAYYVCGLFKIVSYRIRNVIANATEDMIATKRNVSDHSSIREAVAMHTRSINIIDVGINDTKLTYLIMMILAVISFGINLYRFFLAIVDKNDPLEVIISSMLVCVHVVIISLDNHNGQKIMDDSVGVLYDTYNTLWYCTPLGMQKMLLMIMHRSSIECACNLSGLFIPSHRGFTKMMSTSFSYFTLLYSVQYSI